MATDLIITAFFIALILVILTIILFKTKAKPQLKDLNLPPGSYGWPILGETIEFIRTRNDGSPEKFIGDRMKKYNTQIFKTSLLGESIAVLCGPTGNKLLFSNENKLVTVWWPASVRKLLGTCLATTEGIQGMQMRKMVSYFVSPDAFTKLYIKTMDIVSQQHITTHWQGKDELKVFPAIKLYTFELACRLFMSIEDPAQIKMLAALFNVFLGGIISIPFDFPGTKFYKAKRATADIKKELGRIVRQRKKDLEQKIALPSQDLLSHLLVSPDENGKFMSESVIVNNILLLLFAGHDTSSCAITMLMKTLAEHPQFYWNALVTHTDSSLFPDDTKFDPSRFDGAGPIPYSFVPFGGGPRMCLGKEFARLEILTFLHNIIRRFRWNLLIPGEKIKCDPIPTPEKGLPIHLRPHIKA
ncbi:hypothetical protein DH2020_025719 [Rehmannia glutinosa]|uniref:Cytochrome P450 n=1 Tax=Rehmannia glutinosa TaxID=99300 RepID=A0ABR0VZV7_REHGL